MKIEKIRNLLIGIGLACAFGAGAQTNVTATFKHITVDGSFGDWAGVPIGYTAPAGNPGAIQYQNVYLANDQSNLYIRFTLYAPRDAFNNSYDNIFLDGDNNPGTGFQVGGIGSSMLIQGGAGYQEKNSGFNEGGINGLGWNIVGSGDSLDYEISISLGATFASDGTPVIPGGTFALLLEGDDTGFANVEFVPPTGGLVYTLASAPASLTTNLPLVTLSGSSWRANAAGADLGVTWLGQAYDDTVAGWTAGTGLFGYTPSPGSYPTIHTPLSSGPNTYYFRTHFNWTNDTANVAFVVTNYLSDGAVFYLNGAEVRRVRMPATAVAYATAASATNSPVGHADVFGIDGGTLQSGDNILEVEAHQAVGSAGDLVFGASLTAANSYPVLNVNTNLPADQAVLAGLPVTFTSDIIGSGPLSYQWYFGTNQISGANGASYTIPSALSTDAGTYSVKVSNTLSSVTSRSAVLTVSNTPVIITTQPVSVIAAEGKPATFSVVVSGTPLISYQWFFGGNPITNATNASYTINSSLPTNTGSYQVTISNPANSTNSAVVNLSVLVDTIPPTMTAIVASSSQIVITFSEPVDATTANDASKYSISGGIGVLSAVQNVGNPAQVTLTTTVPMSFGTLYTLTVNGVKDPFGNVEHNAGQFARDITIDGAVDDWTGLTPVYSSGAPGGNTNAADFKDIYVYNDDAYYYFRVTLWADIDPSFGQFPAYVNMFFDADNNAGTGYSAIGSDFLVQSGFSYQEKNGGFNDGFSINGLNWLSLPASPGTNFEFRLARAATFQDASLVFTTNQFNFLFQGMNPSFVVQNTAPPSGVLSYTNVTAVSVPALPLGRLSIAPLPGKQAAVLWDLPGTLQQSSAVSGGTWTNLPAAVSPYVIPSTDAKQFFRLTR